MYWTTGPNATAYSSLTVNGVPQFQPANPAGGIPNGTQLTSAWHNDVQGELINILLAANIAPGIATPTQVLQGLKRMLGGNVTSVSASGTLTADQLGYIEITGASVFTQTLPSPGTSLSPPVKIFNASSVAQNLAISGAGNFSGPGGTAAATMTIGPGQMVLMCSDGTNYIVEGGSAKTRYFVAQSGSISIANYTTYSTETQSITFPAYSKTGSFRVRARMIAKGASTAAPSITNFTSTLIDGTNTFIGAPWLVYSSTSTQTWGTSDSITTYATYAPGSTVTFTHQVTTSGSSTSFTITGSSMELFVEEA